MRKYFIVYTLVILAVHQVQAQHIKRKGSLGVGFYQKTPDSLVTKLGYQQGAVVQFAVPNSTAASLGLHVNDIIIRVNDITINNPTQLPVVAKTLRAQEPIEVNVIRNNKEMKLSGTVMPRPLETSNTAIIEYGEFAYQQGYVRTIYKAPKDKSPLGTIYFLQGLPCYSMDNFTAFDKTKQAIDAMVDRGFAVYRMEKADMGDNVNMAPCETMGFNAELEMYDAGYKNLLTLKQVDTGKIILFGHSMGGVTAPLLAAKYQPKAVVVYGTVFKHWLDYLIEANMIQSSYYGDDTIALRKTIDAAMPYINDYFYTNKTADDICKTAEGTAALELIMSYDPKTKLGASGRAASVHKELNQHDLSVAWAKTNSHVLAIYGECDIAANNASDHQALIDHVNRNHPGKGQFWLAPKTTHTFEEIGSMQDFIKWQKTPAAYYQYAATKFNPKVFDHACNWMKEVLVK